MNKTFVFLIGLLCGILICFYFTGLKPKDKEYITLIDTIYSERIDTLFYEKPVLTYKKIIKHDTIKFTNEVVKQVNDTVFLDLPITQKVYSDSSFIAYVSGYNPSLDSINIFQKDKTILINQNIINNKKKRFSIGPMVGIGYDFSNNKISPTVGLSIQYNLISF